MGKSFPGSQIISGAIIAESQSFPIQLFPGKSFPESKPFEESKSFPGKSFPESQIISGPIIAWTGRDLSLQKRKNAPILHFTYKKGAFFITIFLFKLSAFISSTDKSRLVPSDIAQEMIERLKD